MSDWARVVNTTTKDFIRTEENNILRNRKLTAMLKEKGRFSMNHGGEKQNWKVRYKRAAMQGYADSETLVFPRQNRWKSAESDWRGYSMTDSMSKMERLKNKSVAQIIDVYSQIAQNLKDDFEENFATEFYIDGGTTANAKRINGIETFLAAGSVGAFVAAPNDTYAGLSTVLGNYGGGWTGTWPGGQGDDHYDFWSPLLLDYQNASLSGATKTWENTCLEILRYGILHGQRNRSKKGALDTVMLDRDLYRLFLNRLDEKERIMTQRSAANSLLIKLGFGDVTNFDGVDITWEYGVPIDTGYGLNVDMMEVRSMQKTLIVVDGPEYDISTKSWRFSLDFFGNVVWNPRNFFKLYKFTP
jgi:hypothetical protein